MIEVLKRPVVTEKAMQLAELRQYVFEVQDSANKIQIKKAIEEYFDVEVKSVRTLRTKGKKVQRYSRSGWMRGKKPTVKKAYVTLKEGYEIELVTGAGSAEE